MSHQRPNLLFLFSDQHRWDYVGYESSGIQTPNLDKLTREGTTLGRMYSTSPLCVPQRISITTGRYPTNTGCYSNRHAIGDDEVSFAAKLREAGYQTAMIGKFHNHVHAYDVDYRTHVARIQELGFDHVCETAGKQGAGTIRNRCAFTDFLHANGQRQRLWDWTGTFHQPKAGNHDPWPWDDAPTQDEFITRQVEDYLTQVDTSNSPFFLHAGLVGPHPPFDAPTKYRHAYENFPAPQGAEMGPDELADYRAYLACITEVDEKVGRILAALEARGLRDNTVIIYTSDHGEFAGERGRWHKVAFHEPTVHIPAIVTGPGIAKGRRTEALCELVDLGKTFCDYADTESHSLDQGRSMRALWENRSDTHRENVFCEMGSDKMIFDGRYKLMFGDITRDRRQEFLDPPIHGPAFGRPVNLPPDQISLYDLEEDPRELNNLADSDRPEHRELLAKMKEKLLIRMIENSQAREMDMSSVM